MAEIYLPIDATSSLNIEETLGYLKLFKNKGLKTGLMFLILGGRKSLTGELKKIQYQNFTRVIKKQGALPVMVMASCSPLSDLDFYHLPEKSIGHIKKAIDFAVGLPGQPGRPIVTFHLNTLMAEAEWQRAGNTPDEKLTYWIKQFNKTVWPALKKVNAYANKKNTELKIETTPVPEFGDIVETSLNVLGNPYPLYSGRGFNEVRAAGLGLALDLCHTNTLYQAAKNTRADDLKIFNVKKGLFPSDVKKIINQDLRQEVKALRNGDVVHLNDGKGSFDPIRGKLFKENIALGDGEINHLPQIIKSLTKKKIKLVFEIDDADYSSGRRPNLKKSIKYFLKLI